MPFNCNQSYLLSQARDRIIFLNSIFQSNFNYGCIDFLEYPIVTFSLSTVSIALYVECTLYIVHVKFVVTMSKNELACKQKGENKLENEEEENCLSFFLLSSDSSRTWPHSSTTTIWLYLVSMHLQTIWFPSISVIKSCKSRVFSSDQVEFAFRWQSVQERVGR